MIKNELIEVDISYRNITHYRKLGYNPIINERLNIKTIDLPTSSHVKVEAICEICGSLNEIIYHKYIVNKKRHGFYGCRGCSRQKAALTSIETYGVDNYSKTDEYKVRVEKTNMDKYGYKGIYREINMNIDGYIYECIQRVSIKIAIIVSPLKLQSPCH